MLEIMDHLQGANVDLMQLTYLCCLLSLSLFNVQNVIIVFC